MMNPKPFDESFKPPAGLPRGEESEHGKMLGIDGKDNALLNIGIKRRLEKSHLLGPDLYRRRNPLEDETGRNKSQTSEGSLRSVGAGAGRGDYDQTGKR